jgi:hypothetical protein
VNNLTLIPQPGNTIVGDTSLILDVGLLSVTVELVGTDWRIIDTSFAEVELDVPMDGQQYLRQNGEWTLFNATSSGAMSNQDGITNVTVLTSTQYEAVSSPLDSVIYLINDDPSYP